MRFSEEYMPKSEPGPVPGVEGSYPTHSESGKELVYYCPHCQEIPDVTESQQTMALAHDACTMARFNVYFPVMAQAVAEFVMRNTQRGSR